MPSMVLPPKVYARELEREKQIRRRNWQDGWGEQTEANVARVARNVLTSQKVFEGEDRGRLGDVREAIAVLIAPWLKRWAH